MDDAALTALERTGQLLDSMATQLGTISTNLETMSRHQLTMVTLLEAVQTQVVAIAHRVTSLERAVAPGPARQAAPRATGGSGWSEPRAWSHGP
jgi:hypothetical protein